MAESMWRGQQEQSLFCGSDRKWLLRSFMSFGLLACFWAASQVPAVTEAVQKPPSSLAPALDMAAKGLAEGQLDTAEQEFKAIVERRENPPFVRGLAMLGRADVALARRDFTGANAVWERLAADTTLPQFHRDAARRRRGEVERLQRGLPARDPDACRAQLQVLPEPGAVFHVAPAGIDAADGSKGRPFRTLEQARDAVRALKKSHGGSLPKGGARIVINGGSYSVERTLTLASEDSGAAEAPLVYQAKSGEPPAFCGGTRITGWRAITDAKLREKLDPTVRDRVLEADLKALGMMSWGDATALRRRPDLFADGQPQTLARWPNEGFVKTGEILGKDTFRVWNTIEGCRDGKFRYLEDRPSRWLDEPDVRLYGYWFWDWLEEYQKVASIDADARTFTTNLPFESWVEIFGCERLTGALLDRLTHRVHILEANGPSYRLRQSKRRLPRLESGAEQNDQTDLEPSSSDDESKN